MLIFKTAKVQKKMYFCGLEKKIRKVGRVAEGSGFENRRSVTTTRGSNPLLSAKEAVISSRNAETYGGFSLGYDIS